MSEQSEVIIYFSKEHSIRLATENPEELLDLITQEHSGWFRYNGVVVKRDGIIYAGIARPKSPSKARAVRQI